MQRMSDVEATVDMTAVDIIVVDIEQIFDV